MEILEHGTPETLKRTKVFKCGDCGCLFKADEDEYEYEDGVDNYDYWLQKQEEEYKEAVNAVDSGDNSAKTKLAWYLLSGCGGAEVDKERAVELLKERVEEEKDGEAMWMLGICKEYGIGCEQDLEEAEGLYKECSECGNVVGKFFEENGKDERGSGVMGVGSLR